MTKKIKTVEEPIKLWLEKDSYTEHSERNHEDEWDRGDSHTSWSFGDLYLSDHPKTYRESFPVDFKVKEGDTVFVVVAVWSTGDSFGHDSGYNSEIYGIYRTEKEADARQEFMLTAKDKYGNQYWNTKPQDRRAKEEYFPWFGYFEGLDYVEILKRKIEK